MDKSKTYYCLGNGALGCDGCGTEENWWAIDDLPDEFRKRALKEFVRVDDTVCILKGRPWFVQTTKKMERVQP